MGMVANLRTADVRSRLLCAKAAEVVGNTPKEFADFSQNESISWQA